MISPWKNFQQHIVHNVHHTAMILQLKALLHLLSLLYSIRINTVIQYKYFVFSSTCNFLRQEWSVVAPSVPNINIQSQRFTASMLMVLWSAIKNERHSTDLNRASIRRAKTLAIRAKYCSNRGLYYMWSGANLQVGQFSKCVTPRFR